MKILIISGFLGAGKTTFIKELINRTGKNIVVMENEFGDTTLDSDVVSSSGVDVLEFMEGCVCCSKKDSFINSVLTVSSTIDPEYLVIEPTGVAELGSILASLRKLCYGRISLARPVTVISPSGFQSSIANPIYRDQIRNAAVAVLSKTENSSVDEIDFLCNEIKKFNPEIEIVKEHYSQKSDEWWEGLLCSEHALRAKIPVKLHAEQLEELSVKGKGVHNISELVALLRELLNCSMGNVIRAKGEIFCGSCPVRFDLAEGMYSILGIEDTEITPQCVFIGSGLQREKIMARLAEIDREAE